MTFKAKQKTAASKWVGVKRWGVKFACVKNSYLVVSLFEGEISNGFWWKTFICTYAPFDFKSMQVWWKDK